MIIDLLDNIDDIDAMVFLAFGTMWQKYEGDLRTIVELVTREVGREAQRVDKWIAMAVRIASNLSNFRLVKVLNPSRAGLMT